MKAKSATMNCDPEHNDEDKASKPFSYEEQKKLVPVCYVLFMHSSWKVLHCKIIKCNFTCHFESNTERVLVMLMSD